VVFPDVTLSGVEERVDWNVGFDSAQPDKAMRKSAHKKKLCQSLKTLTKPLKILEL